MLWKKPGNTPKLLLQRVTVLPAYRCSRTKNGLKFGVWRNYNNVTGTGKATAWLAANVAASWQRVRFVQVSKSRSCESPEVWNATWIYQNFLSLKGLDRWLQKLADLVLWEAQYASGAIIYGRLEITQLQHDSRSFFPMPIRNSSEPSIRTLSELWPDLFLLVQFLIHVSRVFIVRMVSSSTRTSWPWFYTNALRENAL